MFSCFFVGSALFSGAFLTPLADLARRKGKKKKGKKHPGGVGEDGETLHPAPLVSFPGLLQDLYPARCRPAAPVGVGGCITVRYRSAQCTAAAAATAADFVVSMTAMLRQGKGKNEAKPQGPV